MLYREVLHCAVLALICAGFVALGAVGANAQIEPPPAAVPDSPEPATEAADGVPQDQINAPEVPVADTTGAAVEAPSPLSGNIAAGDAVLDLSAFLSTNPVTDPAQPGSAWFTLNVVNRGDVPLSRVLLVADPPNTGASISPPLRRPSLIDAALIDAASSDRGVIIEQAASFGPYAFRIVLPPAESAALALHFDGVTQRPILTAWTESALIASVRHSSALNGMVAGLSFAALALAAGIAFLSRRPFAAWAALFLAALTLADLITVRVLDDSWFALAGGPYGLFGLALALALAAGSRLVDHVASYEAFWARAPVWTDRIAILIVVIGIGSFLGVPGTGLLIRVLAVAATAAAVGYLMHCGRLGVAAARRLAPAATIFALITALAALRAGGLFGSSLVAPALMAGFSAVGAVLVAMTAAVAAEEPSLARLRAMRNAREHDDFQAATTDEGLAISREHSAVVASHQGVFDLDLESGLLSLSTQAVAILELRNKTTEIAHAAWLELVHPEDRAVYRQAIETYRNQPDRAFRLEFRLVGNGGAPQWYELRATMIGEATEPERCLGLIANISARKELECRESVPEADELTGLGNRLALFEQLEEVRAQFARLALLVLDLDRFKAVNLSLGADGGDALLRAFATRLTKSLPATAKTFRVGGDMFAVLAPKPQNPDKLSNVVMDGMAKPFTVLGREIYLPLSVGVAFGDGVEDAQEFLARAELAMVQAKREGGACARLYSESLTKPSSALEAGDPVALDTNLRRALLHGQIEVHYQPIVRVADGSVAGFEALLRWRHPEYGLIEPDEFIPYAERVGLIFPLGSLALRRAADDLARWQHVFPLDPPLFVSVNVTWRQIEGNEFADELRDVLAASKLSRHTLRLEITESAVMAGAEAAEAALTRLSALGAGLAIDDFGTGHSSLGQLRRFPFDVVKIDRTFLAAGDKDRTIFASMVRLAHELGLQVVVEGVETAQDAERLRDLKCEYAQGFFYGAPMPATEIQAYIAKTYAL